MCSFACVMQNVKQIWKETSKQLEKVYDRREAETIAYLLLEDTFDVKRTDILVQETKDVSLDKFENSINRLLNSEPIQYVTGIADFYGRKFHLSPGVLIPRPETEDLCELIIKENKSARPKIMDVGVGSGCITITLAAELDGDVFGIDVSDKAIEIASGNAERLGIRSTFLISDVLQEELPENNLDILVSNPPYIPFQDQKDMRENVLEYEPEISLFVPDEDPILFYKCIGDCGINSLKSGGKLYFEIHENFGSRVKDYLQKVGYVDVNIHQDMQGKDRMISAINSTNK